MRVFLSLLTLFTATHAFVSQASRRAATISTTTTSTAVSMAPRFDKKEQKWYPTSPEEGPEAGYPVINTLLLHGPKPWLQRVFQKEEYEQAVLKFMAGDKCDRNEAQGNMDAYLNNPNDWAFNRFAYENGGYKPDYVTLKKEALVLTLTWSAVVFVVGGRVLWAVVTGGDFWSFIY